MYIVSLTAKAHFPDIYFVTLPLNGIEAGTAVVVVVFFK